MTSTIQEQTSATGINGAPRHGEQLEGAATGLLNQAARTADAQASTTMTRVGQTLDGVARAIDDAASGLRDSQPEVANLVGTAAERVSEAATYLRDHNASDALDEVQQLARRQPALVIGGGLALGLVLGRLLRTGTAVAQSDMRAVGPYTGARGTYGASTYGTTGYGTSSYGSSGYSTPAYGATAADASAAYDSTSPADELAATDAAVDDASIEGLTGVDRAGEAAVQPSRTKRGAR